MADKPMKKCFVISPIGDPTGPIRAESDWLLNGVIRPALEPEFEVERADIYPKNDVITNQVILAIKNADLIVADLTGHNPNVFYELAVAHAFEKPVVPMIRADQTIPFDNHLMGTIHYSRNGSSSGRRLCSCGCSRFSACERITRSPSFRIADCG
jgi:hypothetical protein